MSLKERMALLQQNSEYKKKPTEIVIEKDTTPKSSAASNEINKYREMQFARMRQAQAKIAQDNAKKHGVPPPTRTAPAYQKPSSKDESPDIVLNEDSVQKLLKLTGGKK